MPDGLAEETREMRTMRIRNPNEALVEETPLDVWLEPNGGSQVNLWVGKGPNKQCVARLQLGNFRGDVHLRLPRLDPAIRAYLGIGYELSAVGLTATNIAIDKE